MRLDHYASLFLLVVIISACGGGGGGPVLQFSSSYTAFVNPEKVTVSGYDRDIMEPFISRDGSYLFFNDDGSSKDIFYATSVNGTTFQFAGAITAINTLAVEGAPTMDAAGNFYYVSTANYNPPGTYDTLYGGAWNGGTVSGSAALPGLARTTSGFIDFDIEVSPDGSTIYFNEGDFTAGNNFPVADEIIIAVKSGGVFVKLPNSSDIMATVNTAKLEYAPAISANGLELFFTRLDLNTRETGIYRATRTGSANPFDAPRLVSAITGFVEGPALSPDEKSLYYHKRSTAGDFELYRVTRP